MKPQQQTQQHELAKAMKEKDINKVIRLLASSKKVEVKK